ncbi:hypothetical protein [Geobacter sp. DSM 9736]|uniref:hypothetical protein n=1 Tax=Geobacter sp. DSM 9736 TaxID=1277350 RepID=UPI0012FDCE98|nr:hypothetical protein [Geobacter sp. DSM 9736]
MMISAVVTASFMGGEPVQGLECGFITRDKCEEVCQGKEIRGCRSCGFLCEECDCGLPVNDEMVCCHMKGPSCDSATVPDAFQWLRKDECDRFWAGTGEKTCPRELCDQ